MPGQLTKAQLRQIKQEAKRLLADEDVTHNRELHRQILASWREQRPAMWQRLQKERAAEPLAVVLQERMWVQMEALIDAGVQMNEARNQAERDHLMLGEESED